MIEKMKTWLSDNKLKIIGLTVVVAGSFALGRYTVPTKTVTETKIVEVEKKVTDEKIDKKENTHKETVQTETQNKDGSKVITTTTTEDTNANTNQEIVENDQKTNKTDSTTITTTDGTRINLSLLGGVSVLHPEQGFIIGGSVSTKLIGPTNIGLWGLSNATGGVSVGVTF